MSSIQSPELIAQARLIHQHLQRMRAYLTSGETPGRIWQGMGKAPTFPQIRTLFALNLLGPCQLKDLSRMLDISDPAASEMVDRLVEMKLVTRDQDPVDRRRVILRLTADARRRVEAHEHHTLERIMRLLDTIGPEQVAQWVDLAERMTKVVQSTERKVPTREH
ncbi:MAG: hypothetical protein PWP23_1311 [Candidatus Sumerlaeota bacterium]|nr:hypothetical protein [Candidatus Sumerlaeota bacterium]